MKVSTRVDKILKYLIFNLKLYVNVKSPQETF
jgi:hypothetical protein